MSVYSVNVYPSSTTIRTGNWYYGAYAVVNASSNCNTGVRWYSNNTSIATVNASSGYIYAKAPGTTRIYAQSTVDSSKKDYITVTVTSGTICVESVTLNRSSISLEKGDTFTLSATVCPTNATNKSIGWRSSNTSVATVSGGVVTAKARGYAYIYADAQDGSGEYDTCYVNVTDDILVSSVTVSPSSKTMNIGASAYLYETVRPTNATNKCVKWSSNKTSVATVNPDTGLVIAQGAGTATITATAQDGSNKKGYCTIVVELQTYNVSNIKVYQSPRTPGKNADCTTAQDMVINNKSKQQLYNMFFNSGSFCVGNIAAEYDENPESVENKMYDLATIFCANNEYMWLSARRLISHFLSGTGTDFREGILTLHAFNHESTQRFVNKTKERIINYLSQNRGNIYSMANSTAFSTDITENVGRPHYDTPDDLWNGLKICVNDTWGNFIEIKDYTCDGYTFSGTIKYTIYDHFGLDDTDITGDAWYLSGVIPNLDQFVAWYVLQHYEGCNGKYKPFVTYMEMEIPFNGCIC